MLEKRRKRDEKDFESDMASAMIVNAQKRSAMMREKTMALHDAQKDSVILFWTLILLHVLFFFSNFPYDIQANLQKLPQNSYIFLIIASLLLFFFSDMWVFKMLLGIIV